MNRYIVPILLLSCISSSLYSLTEISSLEEIQKFGKENSIEYKNSLLNLEEATEDVEGILKLDSTSISVRTSNNNLEIEEWGLNTSVEIPIIEQLSIIGDMDQDLSGTVGLSISPLAHTGNVVQSEINYKKALIEVEGSLLEAQNSVVSASLNWMKAKRDMDLQDKRVILNELLYNDDKDRYNVGDITLDELQDSLITWSESRKVYLELKQSYKQAEKSLYSSLGVGPDDVKVDVLTIEDIEESLTKLKESINTNQGNFLKSSSFRLSNYSVESAKENFENTWSYEPNLTAGVGMTYYQDGSEPSLFNASVNFSINLDHFQKNKRDRAEEFYSLSVKQMELQRNEAELDFNQGLEELESSQINSEIYKIEYEQALILLSEAKLLYNSGDYSEVDLEQSNIYLEAVTNSLFNSFADEYKAWMEFRVYL